MHLHVPGCSTSRTNDSIQVTQVVALAISRHDSHGDVHPEVINLGVHSVVTSIAVG